MRLPPAVPALRAEDTETDAEVAAKRESQAQALSKMFDGGLEKKSGFDLDEALGAYGIVSKCPNNLWSLSCREAHKSRAGGGRSAPHRGPRRTVSARS